MTEEDKKTPVFPFVPDKISQSQFRVFECGDFSSDAEVEDLIQLLWEEPETAFYYYFPVDEQAEEKILACKHLGIILMSEMERRHYKHPKFVRDYVRIVKDEGGYRWDWEREVVEKGPEYWKVTLTLSNGTRTELDTRRKVELEDHYRTSRLKAKYSFDAFLSYSASNSSEADLIYSKATAAGLRIFMAPKVLVPGFWVSRHIWRKKLQSNLGSMRFYEYAPSPNRKLL